MSERPLDYLVVSPATRRASDAYARQANERRGRMMPGGNGTLDANQEATLAKLAQLATLRSRLDAKEVEVIEVGRELGVPESRMSVALGLGASTLTERRRKAALRANKVQAP